MRKIQKVRENSNWKSKNVKKCGEIQIDCPQISKNAGDSDLKKVREIQIEISHMSKKTR